MFLTNGSYKFWRMARSVIRLIAASDSNEEGRLVAATNRSLLIDACIRVVQDGH